MAKSKKSRGSYVSPAKRKGPKLPKKGRYGSRFDLKKGGKRRAYKFGRRGWYAISGWIVKGAKKHGGGKKKGRSQAAPAKGKGKGKKKGRSAAQKAATAKLVASNRARAGKGKKKGRSSAAPKASKAKGKKKGAVDKARQEMMKGLTAEEKARLRRGLPAFGPVYGPALPAHFKHREAWKARGAAEKAAIQAESQAAQAALRARLAARKAAQAILAGGGGAVPLPKDVYVGKGFKKKRIYR